MQAFQQVQHPNGLRPSGADLLGQLLGRCTLYRPEQGYGHSYSWPFKMTGFLIFQTGFKLPTHTHLQGWIRPSDIPGMEDLSGLSRELFSLWIKAACSESQLDLQGNREEDLAVEKEFFSKLHLFRQNLFKHGLELDQTTALIEKIMGLMQDWAKNQAEPVGDFNFGVKGAGALGADTLVIWLPKFARHEIRLQIEEACPSLSFVSSDLDLTDGLRVESKLT
jgi:hypothetical protein